MECPGEASLPKTVLAPDSSPQPHVSGPDYGAMFAVSIDRPDTTSHEVSETLSCAPYLICISALYIHGRAVVGVRKLRLSILFFREQCLCVSR